MNLAFRFSQSLPITGYSWHTLPSTLKFPAQGQGCPCPRGSSLHDPDILATHPFFGSFCTFGLLGAVLDTPRTLPLPISPHGSGTCPVWTLPDVAASSYALPHIWNKLPPPELGVVMSFPLYFCLSFRFPSGFGPIFPCYSPGPSLWNGYVDTVSLDVKSMYILFKGSHS